MEGVSTFLESSTIHGLTYISTTRKYARLFWILVVIAGFVGASLLIKEAFYSWSESPIKTTVETLPISEMCKVSIVVLIGLSDQESKDSLMSRLAPTKPPMTTRIQNSLAYFRVVEI